MDIFRVVRVEPSALILCAVWLCAIPGFCVAQSSLPPVAPQSPASQDTSPAGQIINGQIQEKKPLTPEEIRQREIDRFDPLSPLSPTKQALPGDPAASGNASPPRPPSGSHAPPIPGSVADSAQPSPLAPPADGPSVVTAVAAGDDNSSSADTRTPTGPAVLSRSYTISRPVESKDLKWVWTVGSNEIWQNGIVTRGATAAAPATNGDSFGTSATFSFAGRHLWKKDQIGLNYSAAYSKYFSNQSYNGLNQNLNLDYEHYFSRHLSVNVVEVGSILSQNSTLLNPLATPGASVANLDLAASPTNQVLDLTTRQSNTSVSVAWQASARLSYSLSESFFVVERTGTGLVGTTGYQSQADVNYRWSHATTVGLYYSFSDYLYTKHISTSATHSMGAIYSYAFDRRTQLRLRAGVARVETLSLTLVPIDPVFAALVGTTAGIVDEYSRRYTTDISAQFIRDLGRKRSVNVSYARGIAPGNGLILTSIQQSLTGSFSATVFHTYLLSVTGGRTGLNASGANTGSYTSDFVSAGISHSPHYGPSASFLVSYRTYAITNMPGIQKQLSVSTGLTWSPGPGRLW